MTKLFSLLAFLFWIISGQTAYAQADLQKKLEAKRQNLQKEILQINKQLLKTKQSESTALDAYDQIKRRIIIRQRLIRNLQREINQLNWQIKQNEKKSRELSEELKQLKADYAKMIRQSYQTRSRQEKLYFLFSAESFQQAFKRAQYLKQYAKYRKRQAQQIVQKQAELKKLKETLEKNKSAKTALYQDYKAEQEKIKQEQAKQLAIVNKIKHKKSYYLRQIKAKQREQQKIDKLIDELIKKAIAKSNRKVKRSKRSTSKFFLTPEGKKLAAKFSANKGALPWPVKKAYISRKFGKQPHEIFKNVKVVNTGIYLVTEPDSKVYSVFDGQVLQIQLIPGGNNTVFIKHGNYISIYGNLKEVYVKPGEKVKTRQVIGKVATRNNGKTELKFRIYKNTTKLNPELWLQRR
ncbi:MAG TPA: peptidase M23 [Flavobacteriales bacterium]|jgi:septal ring factor EnvC (AmiA/AmiB activator)|nr:peptidase M23 [Flavobacteriales bacterium]